MGQYQAKYILDYYIANGVDEALDAKATRKYGQKTPPKASGVAPAIPSAPYNRDRPDNQNSAPDLAVKEPAAVAARALSALDDTAAVGATATTLDALRTAIENYTGCALKKGAMHTVFADGNPAADIMLVGEAPGAEEDKLGKPFVGASGQLLDLAFAAIGYDRTRLYISNIIPWRPPGNRNPTPQEVAQCLPFIRRHIELKRPKILVTVGGVAAKALLDTKEGIMRLRGHWQEYTLSDGTVIPTLPIYHPAFLLRSPGQKRVMWKDLLLLKQKIDELNA